MNPRRSRRSNTPVMGPGRHRSKVRPFQEEPIVTAVRRVTLHAILRIEVCVVLALGRIIGIVTTITQRRNLLPNNVRVRRSVIVVAKDAILDSRGSVREPNVIDHRRVAGAAEAFLRRSHQPPPATDVVATTALASTIRWVNKRRADERLRFIRRLNRLRFSRRLRRSLGRPHRLRIRNTIEEVAEHAIPGPLGTGRDKPDARGNEGRKDKRAPGRQTSLLRSPRSSPVRRRRVSAPPDPRPHPPGASQPARARRPSASWEDRRSRIARTCNHPGTNRRHTR